MIATWRFCSGDPLSSSLFSLQPVNSIPTFDTLDDEQWRSVGYDSASKPHVFVAMPFAEDMEDHYDYGIKSAVNAAGYICERADKVVFGGDIMSWVKSKIESATFVVADITRPNPNVYLEVGYAWGCRTPTILLTSRTDALEFDTQGQRCVVYRRIRDLEEKLRQEIAGLDDGGQR